ncbi:MAG: hypothetical protein ABI197_07045 [Granulicella sp.]
MADGGQSEAGKVQSSGLVQAVQVAQEAPLQHAPNGVRYAAYGQNNLASGELERIVQAVPVAIAGALEHKAYYFVPLAMLGNAGEREHRGSSEETMIASTYTAELSDQAICHRNVALGAAEGIFISTRLLNDRFALAFEFFINVGHAFAETAGVPEVFNTLVWEQALKDVRGETSQDAWESRGQSLLKAHSGSISQPKTGFSIDEKAKTDYLSAAFADAVAIYQLSLSVDFNYSELREREYPLLAPQPLAERLRLTAKLFPPNPGYEFAIRYRRRA